MRDFNAFVIALSVVLTSNLLAAAASLPPVSKFKGYTRDAYAAAHKHTALAAQLFCYCGCDNTKKHRTLLDCFRNEHAAHCGICQDEMIRAAGYKSSGMSNKQIAAKIDQEFQSRYPFKTQSGALKRYHALHGH